MQSTRFLWALPVTALALLAQLSPLSQDLRSTEAQAFITKSPTERTADEISQFLQDAPVEFNNRARERVVGLIQREQASVDSALARVPTNLGTAYYSLIRDIENKRLDKQVGASSSSAGGTSLVSRGTVPKILGVAVENGALLQSTRGTVATFRGNLLGISRWFLGAENYPYCPPTSTDCSRPMDFLRGLSFSASFDASRNKDVTATGTTPAGTSTGAVLTGSKQQLESWGVRWDFVNRRDVQDPTFVEVWRSKMKDADLLNKKEAFADATEELVNFTASPEYIALLKELAADLGKPQAATTADCVQILENYLDRAVALAKELTPEFDKTVKEVLETQSKFISARDTLTAEALTRMSFSAEYVNSRPLNQPTQSTLRLVVAGSPMKNENVMLTANAGFNWYNSVPTDVQVKQFRDFQAALQLDRRAGAVSENIDAAFSLAGYFQYMADAALIQIPQGNIAPGSGIILPGEAAVLLAPKGNIWIAEAKLTISIKGTPLKIPVAITWANRTELIKASEVRGNIGLTLDFDSLFMNAQKK